jgi:hypothetical protein
MSAGSSHQIQIEHYGQMLRADVHLDANAGRQPHLISGSSSLAVISCSACLQRKRQPRGVAKNGHRDPILAEDQSQKAPTETVKTGRKCLGILDNGAMTESWLPNRLS